MSCRPEFATGRDQECWKKTSTEERKEIYQLQKSVEPTTRENLTDRIRIAQRWQDSLTLEGFDFFFNQEVANPWKPMDMGRKAFSE